MYMTCIGRDCFHRLRLRIGIGAVPSPLHILTVNPVHAHYLIPVLELLHDAKPTVWRISGSKGINKHSDHTTWGVSWQDNMLERANSISFFLSRAPL